MPRVTIAVTVTAPNDEGHQDVFSLDLDAGLTIKEIKGFIEAESGFPADTQNLFFNGQTLSNDTQRLGETGVTDNDLLAVLIRRRGNGAQGKQARGPPAAASARAGSAHGQADTAQVDPEVLRLRLLSNPDEQQQLRNAAPDLLACLHDAARWREAYTKMLRQQQDAQTERENQVALLNEDPFNIDAQRRIEELIRQDQVMANLQRAVQETPEVFGRVHMLYIDTEVNGRHVKAFVDSGAQATIMSPGCAERCGIMRLVDTRFAGMAKGVGTARILGRVHYNEIKIGGIVMPCSFTVMEGKDVELLFGLDMLKRYKAKIDLDKNALCFEGIEVPFLPEHEIPKEFEDAEVNEPTIPGPNGTEIGAQTGAVRPAGTAAAAAADHWAGGSGKAKAPSQPPPAQSSAGPSRSAAAQFSAQDIQALEVLGFSRPAAIQALEAANGDVQVAAGLLMDNA